LPIDSSITSEEYVREIEGKLPPFLDSGANQNVGLAIYNAGTDVIDGDPLGGLSIAVSSILRRDLFVLMELKKRNIPALMLPSGGYTKQSYKLIAHTVRTRLLN